MKRSKKGKAVYANIGVWREADGSIHMTIKGVKSGHVAVNQDPTRRNGHPTLYARLEQLLSTAPKSPAKIRVQFVATDGTETEGPIFEVPGSN